MKITKALPLLAFACVAVAAGEPAAKKFTPEIHGLLTHAKQTGPVNVCLRQSGSEIRACGYTDSTGHFLIPSSGPLHSAQSKSDGESAAVIPTYWLETGRVEVAKKLWPVDPVTDRFIAVELDCDLSRAGGTGDAFRACDMKTSKAMFATVPRDDSPYRMTRAPKPPAK